MSAFLSLLSNPQAVSGIGSVISGISSLFGGGSDGRSQRQRREQMEDFRYQTDYVNWQNMRNTRRMGEDIRQAANRGGFNPLTLLGMQGIQSVPGQLPQLTSPQAMRGDPGLAFQGVADIMEGFQDQREKEQDIREQELKEENERLRAGFGSDARRQAAQTPQTPETPVSVQRPDGRYTFPDLSNPETFQQEGWRLKTPSMAVFDQDDMPLELETEAYGAAERGQIIEWGLDLSHRNLMSPEGYGIWSETRKDVLEERRRQNAIDAYDQINEDIKKREKREENARRKIYEDLERHRGTTRYFFPPM